jgi:hypothetical protein
MESMKQALLDQMRTMARQGATVPDMLHELIRHHVSEPCHTVTLIQYLRAAFGLSLQQAAPLGGWLPDRAGELSDAALDELILPEIMSNRSRWDPQDVVASA